MARNVEIKAKVADLNQLLQRIAAMETRDHQVLNQCDTFYDVPKGRLKLREFGNAPAELIFYERPNRIGPRQSEYTVTPVPDPASMHELLGRLLAKRVVVRKTRDVWICGQTRIQVDAVEGLGNFVELEVVLTPEQTEADGERITQQFMSDLVITDEDLLCVAYADLLLQA